LPNQLPILGLIESGCLPPCLLPNSTLILDANVIASLKTRAKSAGTVPVEHAEVDEVWDWLDTPGFAVAPLSVAFEGSSQTLPGGEKIKTDFSRLCSYVRRALPRARLIEYTDQQLESLVAWRTDLHNRERETTQFLIQASAMFRGKVPQAKVGVVARDVLSAADDLGLPRDQIAVLCVVAIVASEHRGRRGIDGRDAGAAQRVLKLRPGYMEADAYNALADIRLLQFQAHAPFFGQQSTVLTGDAGMALLWTGLGIRHVGADASATGFHFRPCADLFPRIDLEVLVELLATK
jgi:hypothetical protein